jgi:hypothetical protein
MRSDQPGSADVAIEELRRVYQCQTDKELAAELGLDATSISAWRRRGRVPAKYMLRAQATSDLFFASDGVIGNFYSVRAAYIHSLLAIAARNLSERMWYGDEKYNEIWLGFALTKLHAFLDGEFRTKVGDNSNDEARRLFDSLKIKLSGDEVVSLVAGLPDHFW